MTNVFTNVATVAQKMKDSRLVRGMIDCTVHSIIKASEIRGDNIHSDLQIKLESDPTYQGKYHTSYVTKYIITKATRSAEKQKRAISSPFHLHEKRT